MAYLVAARIKTPGAQSFADLDPNIAFGVFTYQVDTTGASSTNPNRELDLAEIARWGYTGGECKLNPASLCGGNSQFAIQTWSARADNVQRYDIADNGEVTLTMKWNNAQEPVTFKQYNGIFDLGNVNSQTPAHEYATNQAQNAYIPPEGDCVMFMLNLYLTDYQSNPWARNPPRPFTPPPPPQNPSVAHDVVVTNFQFQPK